MIPFLALVLCSPADFDADALAAIAIAKAKREREPIIVPPKPDPVPPHRRVVEPDGTIIEQMEPASWRVTFKDGRVHNFKGEWTEDKIRSFLTTNAASAVAAKNTFRGSNAGYHEGHKCPNCGTYQYTIAGWNSGGTHTHVCPACQTSWQH